MKTQHTSIISILCLLCSTAFAQDFKESYKAVATDRGAQDWFGYAVSISGNYAIISATYEDEDALGENFLNDAGSVYIFERDDNGNWSEKQKLVASDRGMNDKFGCSVSISGNYAIIGAYTEDEDISGGNTITDAGSAYIFERDGYGNWTEVQKITETDREEYDYFGYSVCISETTAIIGAHNVSTDAQGENAINSAGSAYIFERIENGSWILVKKIVASDRSAGASFGYQVSISDSILIAGAIAEDFDAEGENPLTNAGAAYIFEQDEDGNWEEVQKIVASDREEEALFGGSVCVDGNRVFVAALWESKDVAGGNPFEAAGAVYVYERDGNGTWLEVQKLVASDRGEWRGFGCLTGICGDQAIIGSGYSSPSAYIFKREPNGNWNETQKIVHPDLLVDDWVPVAISGDYAIIGAPEESEDANDENTLDDAGAALIFESCSPGSTADPENILENGDFEDCVLAPWSVYNADYLGVTAAAVITGGTCTVTNITLADEPNIYHVQLMQVLSEAQIDRLEMNSTYELTFDAWAATIDRSCRISFEQSIDPWTNIFNETIELSTAPSSYTFEFVITEVFSDIQLTFQLGNETGPATVDNIRLVKRSGNPVAVLSEKNTIRIMPNPARDYIRVTAANGSRIRLYNSLGSMVMESNLQSEYTELDVSNMSRGVYLVEINHGGQITREKVAIQ